MAPGIAGWKTRGEESQGKEIEGGVKKSLPGQWDKTTASKSCKERTGELKKSRSKQDLKDSWEEELLSLWL